MMRRFFRNLNMSNKGTNMLTLEQAVEQVLVDIPTGMAFDSHFVVDELIRLFSDEYLVFASRYSGGKKPTLTTHQQIGNLIDRHRGSLVKRLPYDSYSKTIHGTKGKCAAWRRT
jgi:hypothetical protein